MLKIIIVAVAENGVIGKDNGLPWHHPEDLKMFKRETSGHTVVMGRKTFDSIKKPLPNRLNIVLTRSPRPSNDPNLVFVSSLDEAWARCDDAEKVFVVGGAEIYREALNVVDEVWLTQIPGKPEGDTYFPEYPLTPDWSLYHNEPGESVMFQRYQRAQAIA